MRICSVIAFSLLTQLVLVAPATAADFHVSTAGVNDLQCGSPAAPCKEIHYVLDTFPQDDIAVKIAAGTYVEHLDIFAPLENVSLSCGWNADFTERTAEPTATVLQSPGPTEQFISVGVLVFEMIDVTVDGCTIENSHYGISASNNHGGLSITLHNSILQNNVRGLHSYVTNSGATDIEVRDGSRIQSNTVYGISLRSNGGSDSQLTIQKSFIQRNVDNGVFISAENADGTTFHAEVANSIISGNEGGFRVVGRESGTFTATITNSTISDNFIVHGGGGGLVATATDSSSIAMTLRNSIVWGNTSGDDSNDISASGSGSADSSITANYSTIGVINPLHSGNYSSGTGTINSDPMLTSSFRLRRGSPAIDSAQCGFFVLGVYNRIAPFDDIDGQPRPGYGEITGCDMGAGEFNQLLCFPVKTLKGTIVQICF